jgi:hypothetical protein
MACEPHCAPCMSIRLAISLAILVHVSAARADDCACDVTPAACDTGCACDLECDVDWSIDECADPAAGCLQNSTVPDDATLAAQEAADPVDADPIDWPPAVAPSGDEVRGGCAAASAGWLAAAAVLALLVLRRRRMLALALVACALDGGGWDDAVDRGPTGSASRVDIFAAELGDAGATQFLLAGQPLQPAAQQPVAQFALDRARTGHAISRVAGACGDQLTTGDGEVLGWARSDAGDGTAELVELVAPDACTFAYETDPEMIDDLVARGYTRTQSLGYVWPPGLGDEPASEPAVEPLVTPAPCAITAHSAVELLYSSPGDPYASRFLLGCPGEVVMGDKAELGPRNSMRTAAAHAAGGRTGFVVDRNGDKLRALLKRHNGFERTVAYLKHKLALGYDYIVLDEVTGAADYADGQWLNRAVRALLLRLPRRRFIPYISIDLTQELPSVYMNDRRGLLRAFERRARVLALEVYLHTDQVIAGEAPSVLRRAAQRMQNAVPGIDRHAITTLGATHRSIYPQYRYLDDAHHDLTSITRQVNALRHASRRTRQQHGIGWYFVGSSDLEPTGGYSMDALVRRMRTQAQRFR